MNQLQNFSVLLAGSEEPIFLLKGLRTFWAANKDFWFSHAAIASWETVSTTYKDDLDTNLHLLLHYDQIVRHPLLSLPPLSSTDKQCAHRFATAVALHMLHNGQYAASQPWERVFLLLALRHNPSEGLKTLALRKCLQEAEADPSPLWCRFLSATVWDLHCWREKAGYPQERQEDLDFQQFAPLLEAPRAHPTSVPTARFQEIWTCVGSVEGPRVAVSISGGVDSMVVAWIAQKACAALGKELVLLHISYRNRPECEDECRLLSWYSQRLGVPLYVRRITEIQRIRASGLRAVYEEVTRRIRFAFYRHFDCPVILGHNQDDCLENVFRNLSQRSHLDNLFGMSACSEEQGVVVVRPLLQVPKRDILAFADQAGIPHLYDSTPAWSQRGKMRDQLLPSIRTFDAGILGGLLEMVERSRFLEAQWSLRLQDWLRTVGKELPRDAFLESNRGQPEFWNRVFTTRGFRASNKSIRNFMDMLDRGHVGKCNLTGAWVAKISAESIVFMTSLASCG